MVEAFGEKALKTTALQRYRQPLVVSDKLLGE
jgi:hypothetical protein